MLFTGRKELNCEMMSLVVAAAWQDVVVEVRDGGLSLTVASTGSANESLSGTVVVTERKITCSIFALLTFSSIVAISATGWQGSILTNAGHTVSFKQGKPQS